VPAQKPGIWMQRRASSSRLPWRFSLRCDGCITVHTAAARKLGASREEIAEALGVGISVNAGAALVYSARTIDAFDEAA
jgi:alkylhydroperoxidase/carboxymuconolactone decarboxylase family protein YurZ